MLASLPHPPDLNYIGLWHVASSAGGGTVLTRCPTQLFFTQAMVSPLAHCLLLSCCPAFLANSSSHVKMKYWEHSWSETSCVLRNREVIGRICRQMSRVLADKCELFEGAAVRGCCWPHGKHALSELEILLWVLSPKYLG